MLRPLLPTRAWLAATFVIARPPSRAARDPTDPTSAIDSVVTARVAADAFSGVVLFAGGGRLPNTARPGRRPDGGVRRVEGRRDALVARPSSPRAAASTSPGSANALTRTWATAQGASTRPAARYTSASRPPSTPVAAVAAIAARTLPRIAPQTPSAPPKARAEASTCHARPRPCCASASMSSLRKIASSHTPAVTTTASPSSLSRGGRTRFTRTERMRAAYPTKMMATIRPRPRASGPARPPRVPRYARKRVARPRLRFAPHQAPSVTATATRIHAALRSSRVHVIARVPEEVASTHSTTTREVMGVHPPRAGERGTGLATRSSVRPMRRRHRRARREAGSWPRDRLGTRRVGLARGYRPRAARRDGGRPGPPMLRRVPRSVRWSSGRGRTVGAVG